MEGILFLDDDKSQMVMYRQLAKKYLQDTPVYFAETVPEADRILSTHAIRLAVVDLMIPIENGADLIMKMKDRNSFSEIKIIVVTSARKGTLIHNALTGMIDEFVTKPIDLKELADLVNQALK